MRQYKVVLVDDEITIREGFKRLFDWAAHGCEVVGEAAAMLSSLMGAEEQERILNQMQQRY